MSTSPDTNYDGEHYAEEVERGASSVHAWLDTLPEAERTDAAIETKAREWYSGDMARDVADLAVLWLHEPPVEPEPDTSDPGYIAALFEDETKVRNAHLLAALYDGPVTVEEEDEQEEPWEALGEGSGDGAAGAVTPSVSSRGRYVYWTSVDGRVESDDAAVIAEAIRRDQEAGTLSASAFVIDREAPKQVASFSAQWWVEQQHGAEVGSYTVTRYADGFTRVSGHSLGVPHTPVVIAASGDARLALSDAGAKALMGVLDPANAPYQPEEVKP